MVNAYKIFVIDLNHKVVVGVVGVVDVEVVGAGDSIGVVVLVHISFIVS